ncbi:MAG: hypothetical protein EBR00_10925 [Gammaproteobacteria bacterium]|nr:hypothetical protein [Gammaproteobacteria bacterium]
MQPNAQGIRNREMFLWLLFSILDGPAPLRGKPQRAQLAITTSGSRFRPSAVGSADMIPKARKPGRLWRH